jgi:hypothetical protein
MKRNNLASILAVALSLELMVAPIIPAAHAQDTAQKFAVGIQAIGNVVNQVMGPQMMSPDAQKLRQQQTPQIDKYFSSQKMLQIPGLANYLALNRINPNMLECKTLATTLHDAQPEACRIGITSDSGLNTGAQMNQMFDYYNQYFQISKMYQNFSADSNAAGQAFGIGCMNNAMNILNGFFKYRLDELDKLTTNLEAMQNQFREASRTDLDAIEEAVAVLDGESDIADKVRSKKPDLFDFNKRFNNAACNSMFAGETLNETGRSGGLNSINKNTKALLTNKQGRYSGQSYSQAHAGVVEDISSIADKISKQVELNFNTQGSSPQAYGEFLKNVPSLVSSTSGVQNSIRLDMFADVQGKYTEQYAKLSEEKALLTSELPGANTALSKLGGLNAATFEAEVNTLENNLKNQCLSSSLGSADTLISKIYDPNISSSANKNASNFLADKARQILSNSNTTIEKKLADLIAAEASQGNRYYMKMGNSYEVQELDASGNIVTKVVKASTKRTPSVYLNDLVNNCNAQFKSNKLNNKLTGANAIQRLRQLNQTYKTFAQSQAADVKKELRKKLIECTSSEVANNTVAGSCTPALFDTSSPGFCANAAFSCSKNMQACSSQAEGFVKEIRDQKTARVNNYKTLVEKNKQDIVKIFDSALASFMKEGEAMRGIFGAGFSSPAGIKREVPEKDRYLSSFADATGKQDSPDAKLLLEDPDKYVEMFKDNIALLKDSVKKQQDQILGGDSVNSNKDGLLAAHIKKTKENYAVVIKEASRTSTQCRSAYDSVVIENEKLTRRQGEERMKKSMEMGEKRNKFCSIYGMARTNPQAACGEVQSDLISDALMSAAILGQKQNEGRADVSKLSAYCSQFGNFNEKETSGLKAIDICTIVSNKHPRIAATEYSRYTDLCATFNKECPTVSAEVKEKTESTVRQTVVVDPACEKAAGKAEEKIESTYRLSKLSQPAEGSLTLDEAPAYCSAGEEANRSSGKTIIDAFNSGLNPQQAAATAR